MPHQKKDAMEKTMLTPDEKHARTLQKVEEMGVSLEQAGMPPLRARAFSYLLLAEPPQKDFFEIQEFLQASKSATSNALNDLMKENIVDYITFSGDRRRYFRVNTKGWLDDIKIKVKRATIMHQLMQGVLIERADSQYPEFNEGISKITDFMTFIGEEIGNGIARWEQLNK